MSLAFDRFKHHVKVLIGQRLAAVLTRRYLQHRGPAKRMISGFADNALDIERHVETFSVAQPFAPAASMSEDTDQEYRNLLLSGDAYTTDQAGVLTVRDADVSLPVSMHSIMGFVIQEAMPAPYVLTNPKYYGELLSLRLKRKKQMREGVLLSMPWAHKFYHWMIDFLPRLMLYDRYSHLQDVPIIVPKSAPKFVAESIRLAGYLPKVTFLEDGAYRFGKLHLLSRLAHAEYVCPEAICWLNEKLSTAASSSVFAKRLYISRRDAKIRFVSNEHELLDVLSEFGFEVVTMSGRPLPDQIRMFQTAECIVGPHGAAFSNLAFTTPGTIFIEFFCRGHFCRCFNLISGIRKLRYGFLVGDPTSMGGFSIQPFQLRAALSSLLRS